MKRTVLAPASGRDIIIIQRLPRPLKQKKHRLHQFADMQVRFFLHSVAEHFEFRRIGAQFLEQIKNDPCVARLPMTLGKRQIQTRSKNRSSAAVMLPSEASFIAP